MIEVVDKRGQADPAPPDPNEYDVVLEYPGYKQKTRGLPSTRQRVRQGRRFLQRQLFAVARANERRRQKMFRLQRTGIFAAISALMGASYTDRPKPEPRQRLTCAGPSHQAWKRTGVFRMIDALQGGAHA